MSWLGPQFRYRSRQLSCWPRGFFPRKSRSSQSSRDQPDSEIAFAGREHRGCSTKQHGPALTGPSFQLRGATDVYSKSQRQTCNPGAFTLDYRAGCLRIPKDNQLGNPGRTERLGSEGSISLISAKLKETVGLPQKRALSLLKGTSPKRLQSTLVAAAACIPGNKPAPRSRHK